MSIIHDRIVKKKCNSTESTSDRVVSSYCYIEKKKYSYGFGRREIKLVYNLSQC